LAASKSFSSSLPTKPVTPVISRTGASNRIKQLLKLKSQVGRYIRRSGKPHKSSRQTSSEV
jgi:hypothetical protein